MTNGFDEGVGARAGPVARAGDGERDSGRRILEHSSCSLCGRTDYDVVHADCHDRLLGLPGRFDVVRCRGCGLVRTDPRPPPEAIGSYYPDSYAPFAAEAGETSDIYAALRWMVRLPYRLRYGTLAPPPPRSPTENRLLDIGSGAGLFLEEMANLGWEPWAVEPNRSLARRTVERLRLPEGRIFEGTVDDAEFANESFDLVAMSHVLEHLHDPRRALSRVGRWLRPGGTLRIWIPNFSSLESRVFGRLWHGLDVPRHLYHFSPRTLGALLDATGFDVERVVPQWQGNMLTGSVTYALDELRRRRRPYRESRALHFALLPVASALLTFGEGGALDVTARKREGRDGRSVR